MHRYVEKKEFPTSEQIKQWSESQEQAVIDQLVRQVNSGLELELHRLNSTSELAGSSILSDATKLHDFILSKATELRDRYLRRNVLTVAAPVSVVVADDGRVTIDLNVKPTGKHYEDRQRFYDVSRIVNAINVAAVVFEMRLRRRDKRIRKLYAKHTNRLDPNTRSDWNNLTKKQQHVILVACDVEYRRS